MTYDHPTLDDDPTGGQATSGSETGPGQAPSRDESNGLPHHNGEWDYEPGDPSLASTGVTAADRLDPPAVEQDEQAPPRTEDGTMAAKSRTSAAQWAANRRNAQRSTGPRTEEGKQASSRNAMRHGAYARPHPVPRGILAEDPDEVQGFFDAVVEELAPRDAQEQALARRIANAELNLARIDRYESVGLGGTGRLSRLQDEEGLGVELSACRQAKEDLLQAWEHLELGTEASEGTLNHPLAWDKVAGTLHYYRCVPRGAPPWPALEADIGDEELQVQLRDHVLGVLLSASGTDAAIESIKGLLEYQELDASRLVEQAEEVAVRSAIGPGGIMDQCSALRARYQRSLQRDRESYARLQRRPLPHESQAEAKPAEPGPTAGGESDD